jgi:hypothetical protein
MTIVSNHHSPGHSHDQFGFGVISFARGARGVEDRMYRKIVKTIASGSFALVVAIGAAWQTQAQDHKTAYPSMAPLDRYLITDRNAEIALASSAAPEAISRDATVLVLGRKGYETAVKGKNGWVCVVGDHGWPRSTTRSS